VKSKNIFVDLSLVV